MKKDVETMKVPAILASTRINGKSPQDARIKRVFLRAGRRFLNRLAQVIGLQEDGFTIYQQSADPTHSGSITLQSDKLRLIALEALARGEGVYIALQPLRKRDDLIGSGPRVSFSYEQCVQDSCKALIAEGKRIIQSTKAMEGN